MCESVDKELPEIPEYDFWHKTSCSFIHLHLKLCMPLYVIVIQHRG